MSEPERRGERPGSHGVQRLAGQDAVVAELERAAAAASALLAGRASRTRRDDARVAVHRAAGVGAFGRGPRVRVRAAVPVRRLRAVCVVPPGAGRDACGSPMPIRPEGLSLRREADQGPGASRGGRARGGTLARRVVRGRRPVHRAGGERAAEGDRGARPADGLAAVRAVGGGPGGPRSGHGAGVVTSWCPPRPRWPRSHVRMPTSIEPAAALAAARAAQGHVGRARRLASGCFGRCAPGRRVACVLPPAGGVAGSRPVRGRRALVRTAEDEVKAVTEEWMSRNGTALRWCSARGRP